MAVKLSDVLSFVDVCGRHFAFASELAQVSIESIIRML